MIIKLVPKKVFEKRDLYEFWEEQGFHLVPISHYSPLPTIGEAKKHYIDGAIFLHSVGAVRLNKMVNEFKLKTRDEFSKSLVANSLSGFKMDNGFFENIDAEILYFMIRTKKPSRIIEVGSGWTSRLIYSAVKANMAEGSNYTCRYTIIDPWFDKNKIKFREKWLEILKIPVEETSQDFFKSLGVNDILFVDSSHTVKTGNDVTRIYLEILPNLNPGVLFHAHDIFLPYDYPREWVLNKYMFWNEQYLLAALLINNKKTKILWPSQYYYRSRPKDAQEIFGAVRDDWVGPGSFWVVVR